MCDTPGSKAIENLRRLDDSVVEFKKPTGEIRKKKGKPKILSEEKYIEELSKIIQRDFFPDLDKLNAQNEYLDAMESKNYQKMAALRAKFSGGQHTERSGRSMTPATFETPAATANSTPRNRTQEAAGSDTPKSVISNTSSAATSKKPSTKHSLDSFLQAYTSEDNYSFQEIIESAEERLRQKFAVLYDQEQLSAEKLALALTLPSFEQQLNGVDPMRQIETWNYKNKNSIMYIPDGVEFTEAERVDNANRKQIINHSSTRLLSNPFNETNNPQLATEKFKPKQTVNDKIGVDGNRLQNGATAAPQIRGFDLVKTPSPRPGEAFSPLMTWGEIEGTPFRLDGSDTPVRPNTGPSFKINETSRRETIGLALAEKVGEKMRAQKQRAMDTARKNIGSPFIRSSMERLASMSPAARRLATSKLGLRTPIMTPSPSCSPLSVGKTTSSSSSSAGVTMTKKTPRAVLSGSNTPKQISSGKSTLTDDLLKIPTKRLRASDFF